MKNKNLIFYKNVFLLGIGTIGSKIISFFLLPLYTSNLLPSDFGTADLIMNIAALLIPILLLSIQDATLRFSFDSTYDKKDVISTTVNVIIKGSFVLILIIFLVYYFNFFELNTIYFFFLFFSFFLNAVNNAFILYLKAQGKVGVIAISGIINSVILAFCNVIFLIHFKLGIVGFIYSNFIGILSQILILFFGESLYRDVSLLKYKNLSKQMIGYSFPLIINSISWWINNSTDRFFITGIKGIAESGIYSIAFKIPTILLLFQGVFNSSWSISAISEFDRNDTDGFLGETYKSYSIFILILCSLLLLLNLPLATILYSNDFFIAWQYIPFLLISTMFYGFSQFLGTFFSAAKKTKQVSITTALSAILNVLLNFFLINYIGVIGAALSTMIAYFFMWLFRFVLLRKFMYMKFNLLKHIFSIFIIFIQAVLATLNVFVFFQFLIFIFLLYFYKDDLLNYLKKITNIFFKIQ